MAKLPSHECWRYSLKLYSKPGVENCCLELQKNYRLNVNILLFCCWFAASKRGQIDKISMKRIISEIMPWHQGITEALKSLRKSIAKHSYKPKLNALHETLLADELISEQIEQLLMTHILVGIANKYKNKYYKVNDCISNLNTYLNCANIHLDSSGYELLQQLINAAFPGPAGYASQQLVMKL